MEYNIEYTVQQMATLAGISVRTLHYYDSIGLLCPSYLTEKGYRVYGRRQVDLLQQILFYKALDIPLDEIRTILENPDFDLVAALQKHHVDLLHKRKQLDVLIKTVEKTIQCKKGEYFMNDKERFEGLKQKMIDENEASYGDEIRKKYGDEKVNAANARLKKMTPQDITDMQIMGETILKLLDEAFLQGDPAGDTAQKMADLHRRWLCLTWAQYFPEAHAGLGQMYVDDERFAQYYNRGVNGKAEFMRDAILVYTDKLYNTMSIIE